MRLRIGHAAGVALTFAVLSAQPVWCQTDNMSPLGLAPGAPAGSYALSELERLNLFNGNLNFLLPLLRVGGRGEAQHTVCLPIEMRWGTRNPLTSNVTPRFNWRPIRPGYGPGVLRFHRTSAATINQRFTFTAPDETQVELRDAVSDAEPGMGSTTGRIYRTFDGTAVTYVPDSPVSTSGTVTVSGKLFFPDGRQYRIDNGLVQWIRDRNGNVLQFTYVDPPTYQNPAWGKQVGQITDSLKRTITFAYASSVTPRDTIEFQGFGGAVRRVYVNYTLLQSSLLSGESLQTLGQLFPQIFWLSPTTSHNPTVVSSVLLPNNRSYAFKYNSYGELARVDLPTGGAVAYSYGPGLSSSPPSGAVTPGRIYRRLKQRSAYAGGTPGEVERTIYDVEQLTGPNDENQYIEVSHLDPGSQSILARERHYFYRQSSDSLSETSENPAWETGLEYRIESYDAAGTPSPIKSVEHIWQQRETPPWWTGTAAQAPPNDPRIVQTDTTLQDTSPAKISYSTFQYDRYNNLTNVEEYDFYDGAQYPLLRRITTTYATAVSGTPYAASTTVHLRRLPSSRKVSVGPSAEPVRKAETVYEYDNYALSPLLSRTSATGRSAPESHPATYVTRGNVTAAGRWLSTGDRFLTTARQYDTLGNTIAQIDPKNHATSFAYNDAFGVPDAEARSNTDPGPLGTTSKTFAFVTSATNAKSQTTFAQFDYFLGRVVNYEDVNGVVSSASYSDALDRPTSVVRAAGPPAAASWAKQETQFTYYDVDGPSIDVKVDKDTFQDRDSRRLVVYDGLGREVENRAHEPSGSTISVYKTYDAMGRLRSVSNPTRSGDTIHRTVTDYDELGRVSAVAAPGAAVTMSDNVNDEVTVTEPQGRPRLFRRDALGRVVFVEEDPGPSGQGFLNYPTSHAYDALDNLVTVTQEGQTRTFQYDSLSRLTSASNPEATGQTTSTYDDAGNLATRLDARGTSTTYGFDELDRLTSRSYNDSTPAVSLRYDDLSDESATVLYGKGRLTRITSSPSTTRMTMYDPAGRIAGSSQQTAGSTYPFSYAIDLIGNLRAVIYPSGRIVETTYDSLARIQQVKEPSIVYAGSVSYAAHGLPVSMQLGNLRWESATFNNRLQSKVSGLGQSASNRDLLAIENFFGTNTTSGDVPTANNGNVTKQTLAYPSLTTTYTYDRLNRLATVSESSSFSQTFTYDQFGNRAQIAGLGPSPPETTPSSLSHFNTATNRINTSFSPLILYDNAGNLTRDSAGRTLTYDAENRLTAAGTTTYAYDGDGRRVREVVASSATTYVYDAFGKLVAEYAAGAVPSPPSPVYLTQDHLGSVRLATDAIGGILGRWDYLPFGQHVPTSLGGRSSIAGYGSDPGVRFRFTGKERDSGSGLDYFGARYYSGAQGRFTSVDPFSIIQEARSEEDRNVFLTEPARWNGYTYAGNNPLKFVDPDGRNWMYYVNLAIQRASPYVDKGVALAQKYGQAAYTWAGTKLMTNPNLPGQILEMAGPPGPGFGIGNLPSLKGERGIDMFRDAVGHLKTMGGSGSAKADMFEAFAGQIAERTSGAWTAARVKIGDGVNVFIGESQGQIFVIDKSGKLFRGTSEALKQTKMGVEILWDKLKEI